MLKAILLALLGLSYTIFSIVSVLDGRALDARGKTAQIEDMMQGKPVLIRYLPDKPTTARFEGEKGSGGLDVAIGAIVLLAGGMWFRKKLFEKPDFRD